MTNLTTHKVYPFAAIIGQEKMKLSLLLNAVNPAIGGVLIRGEREQLNRLLFAALHDLCLT